MNNNHNHNHNNSNRRYIEEKCIAIPNDSIDMFFGYEEKGVCTIGKGGFGEVCKGKLKEDKSELLQRFNIPEGVDIAIKKIRKDMFDMNEISILFKIKDLKYISKYYGCLYDDNYIYITMEFIKGEELFNYGDNETNIKNILANILSISTQLAIAIDELHKLGIIHNDIKSENIMVNENYSNRSFNLDIKLIDYGLSCETSDIKKCNYNSGTSRFINQTQLGEYRSKQKKNNKTVHNVNNINNVNNAKDIFKKKDWWAYLITIFEIIFSVNITDKNKRGQLTSRQDKIFNSLPQNIQKLILLLFDRNTFFSKTSKVIRDEIFTTLGIPQPKGNNVSNASKVSNVSKVLTLKTNSKKHNSRKKTCKGFGCIFPFLRKKNIKQNNNNSNA